MRSTRKHPPSTLRYAAVLVATLGLSFWFVAEASQQSPGPGGRHHDEEESGEAFPEPAAQGETPCRGGSAGVYPCKNVDLLSFMPLSEIGGEGRSPGCRRLGLDRSHRRPGIRADGAFDGDVIRRHYESRRPCIPRPFADAFRFESVGRCCMNAGNSLIPLILRFCPKNVTC